MHALSLMLVVASANPVVRGAPLVPVDAAPPPPSAPPPTATSKDDGDKRRVERVAVYDLEATDVPARTVSIVTDALVVELRKLRGLSVVSMDEVRAMLAHEAEKQTLGCADESCLAEIADALGVDTLITGSIAVVGEETVIGLRRIDQRAASTTARLNRRLQRADGTEVLAAIGPLVEEMYPDLPLLPGQTRGVSDVVALRLNPPPVPVWLTASTFGASALLVVGGSVAGALTLAKQGEVEAIIAAGQAAPVDAKSVKDGIASGQGLALATNVLLGAGLAVAVGSAVLVPMTDWLGVGED